MGYRIYSIPCHASYFALQDDLKDRKNLHQEDFNKKMNSLYSSKSSESKIASAARNLINSVHQTAATTFAFSFYLSFFYGSYLASLSLAQLTGSPRTVRECTGCRCSHTSQNPSQRALCAHWQCSCMQNRVNKVENRR